MPLSRPSNKRRASLLANWDESSARRMYSPKTESRSSWARLPHRPGRRLGGEEERGIIDARGKPWFSGLSDHRSRRSISAKRAATNARHFTYSHKIYSFGRFSTRTSQKF